MTNNNRYLRPYQPGRSDYNAEFVRGYVVDSSSQPAADERIADPDSTFARFLSWTLDRTMPPVASTDVAIRIGLPQHGSFIALLIRSAFGFTLPYVLCLGFYHVTAGGMLLACSWCIGVHLLQATFLSFAKQDQTLFFDKLARGWRSYAWLALVWLLWSGRVVAFVPACLFGVVLDCLVTFTSQTSPAGGARAALRVALATAFAVGLSQLFASLAGQTADLRLLYLAGNCLLPLPMVWGMQHWFAANRYASRDDVRRYGQGAAITRAALTRIGAGIWTYLLASATAAACAQAVHAALHLPKSDPASAIAAWQLAFVLVGIVAAGAMQWLLVELTLHGRFPNLLRYVSSFYVTWRALAAWLSYEAPVEHPAVFRFQRPFTSTVARAGLISLALWLNAALTISLLGLWSSDYLASHRIVVEQSSQTVTVIPNERWHDFQAVSRPQYWLPALLIAVFIPPAVLFLSLHAVWGPAFLAYSEHFECFEDQTIPPLLSTSFTGPRRRV